MVMPPRPDRSRPSPRWLTVVGLVALAASALLAPASGSHLVVESSGHDRFAVRDQAAPASVRMDDVQIGVERDQVRVPTDGDVALPAKAERARRVSGDESQS